MNPQLYTVLVYWEYDPDNQIVCIVESYDENDTEETVKEKFLQKYREQLDLDGPEETEQCVVVTKQCIKYWV